MMVTDGSELDLAFGSYRGNGGSDNVEIDADAQYETRIAGIQEATPMAAPQGRDRIFAGTPLIMVLLGIGFFALLLAAAVLLFWLANSRNRETLNAGEDN